MFKNISIAKKLIMGFGIVLIFLFIVSGISYNAIHNASSGFDYYRQLTRLTMITFKMQTSMLITRTNIWNWIATGSEENLKQYTEKAKETAELIKESHERFKASTWSGLNEKVENAFEEYQQSVKEIVAARTQQDELVNGILTNKGLLMEETLTKIINSAEKNKNMSVTAPAAVALKHVLLAQQYMFKFLYTKEQKNADRVVEELEKVDQQLGTLGEYIRNPQQREWQTETIDAVKIYLTSFNQLVQEVTKGSTIIKGSLNRLGPEIEKILGETELSIATEQRPLGPMVESTNNQAIAIVLVLSVIAVIVGTFVAFYITRMITVPVRKAVRFAELVAGGDFSQKIDVKQEDEIGMMTKALAKMGDSFKGAIRTINSTMNRVSQGDFSENIDDTGMVGELVLIRDSINNSIEMLSNTITQVVVAADQVNSGAGQISSASQSLASGTTEQAASLEEISSSMAEVGNRAKTSNDNANQAAQLSTQAMEIANRGTGQMKEMLSSMDKINSSSTNISKIIKVIDEIAFQTNLLALNAAVEAARAGKYGKGFAVVAEEVRNLAARSAEAAKDTTELIENSIKEVESGVSNADKTADILNEINDSVTKVNDLVGEIAAASQEQSNNTEEINSSLNQVNEVVQQNSSISEEAASASEELSGQAMELQALMAHFKLQQSQTNKVLIPDKRPVIAEKKPVIAVESDKKHPKMITLDDDSFGKY